MYTLGAGQALGLLRDGWIIEWQQLEELLDKTDLWGRTLIETFHQGMKCGCSGIFHEWRNIELRLVSPLNGVLAKGASTFDVGMISNQGTESCSAVALTVVAGTPAANNGPITVSIPQWRNSGDVGVSALHGPEHKTLAFRAHMFPFYNAAARGFLSFWNAT